MRILVTGGAGYIGSVTASKLMEHGHDVIVLDNLSRGHREAVPAGCPLEVCDTRDRAAVADLLHRHRIACVMHFAASSLVGESMQRPREYFDANAGGMLSLLGAMETSGVERIVLSSTAAVYGQPDDVPIPEAARTAPTNPYGHSKLMCEGMMHWQAQAGRLRYVSLRYFNAAGASEAHGEDHEPETHLIPIALQVALGKRPELVVYGDDYPTSDGTCIRDYIHVEDLADAHILALDRLEAEAETVVNLGNGKGFSVQEVLQTARKVSGHSIPARVGSRRPGDPPILVASSARARELLGWRPTRGDLETIVESAWKWMGGHPDGYAG
ncbi:MAG: UDP-glucose 4-epimerase GalE [Candidatus Eisenbacteria bacterium]|nr:UDP-glucose 4-epimerase GalE [Candidatus Eisenbacteria bacterium]